MINFAWKATRFIAEPMAVELYALGSSGVALAERNSWPQGLCPNRQSFAVRPTWPPRGRIAGPGSIDTHNQYLPVMKNMFLLLTFMLSAVSGAFGQADPGYGESLKRMFAVSGAEETFQAAIKQTMAMYRQQFIDLDLEIWEELEKSLMQTSLHDLTGMLTPVYAKYLTREDLEAIIVFYESPAGRKLAQNTPFITQESMEIGQRWGMKIAQDLEKRLFELQD